jgi:hypothetical protein
MAAQLRQRHRTRPWSTAPRLYRRGRRGAVIPFPLEARERPFPRWRTAVLVACAVVGLASSVAMAWSGFYTWDLLPLGVAAFASVWAAGPGEAGPR